MFESLTDKLQSAFRKITGNSRISESNMADAMAEVRTSLLAADVNMEVVDKFIAQVKEECLGQDVLNSVTPGQQTVKIVYDKLVTLMGDEAVELTFSADPASPTVIMLCGLHGSGKTTTTAKLAVLLQKKYKKRALLAACDLYRPAAIDQLEVLGQSLSLPVYTERDTTDVVAVATHAVAAAKEKNCPVVILDTAGRLQIDEPLVQELVRVRDSVHPQEILLVADAALGQQAVSVAEHFNTALGITGVILTKLDGDARGGAALSIRHAIGKPIKFATCGEQPQDLEIFHPDRIASRILGMGDILTLVEKAQSEFQEEEARRLEEKMRNATFDFDDFLKQLNRINKMGGLMSMLKFLPGMSSLPTDAISDKEMKCTEAMIFSMTKSERRLPETINASRRARIAKGSGTDVQAVTGLIKTFMNMRDVMAQMSRGGASSMLGSLLGGGGGFANIAKMMGGAMGGMGGHAGAGMMPQLSGDAFGSRGTSQQDAARAARERARKEARRKMAKASQKKNRHK